MIEKRLVEADVRRRFATAANAAACNYQYKAHPEDD